MVMMTTIDYDDDENKDADCEKDDGNHLRPQ